jgi:hypothetical protein
MSDVDLVVNCYERTYRDVLRPGFFDGVVEQNQRPFTERIALINNVTDRADAERRAQSLVERGEITSFSFVADRLTEALRVAGLSRRSLGGRPYFLDYGLVMAITGSSPYLLGWDAEVALDASVDWATPGVDLLGARRDVFSVAPRWPARSFDTLEQETVERDGAWHLGWAFSDQLWLVRRVDLAAPIYRRVAPAALVRNKDHPRTFEARVEAYQRAARRYRATHAQVRYRHNDEIPAVLERLGRSRVKAMTAYLLGKAERALGAARLDHPRLRLP